LWPNSLGKYQLTVVAQLSHWESSSLKSTGLRIVTSCSSDKGRPFVQSYCLHLQGGVVNQARNMWKRPVNRANSQAWGRSLQFVACGSVWLAALLALIFPGLPIGHLVFCFRTTDRVPKPRNSSERCCVWVGNVPRCYSRFTT
jgi:hypothetical protein